MIRALILIEYEYERSHIDEKMYTETEKVHIGVERKEHIAQYVYEYGMRSIREKYRNNPGKLIVDFNWQINGITE